MNARLRSTAMALMRRLHRLDYALFLPTLARLPLPMGYGIAALRGAFNAAVRRDWRSMALGTRHIERQSAAGAAELARAVRPEASVAAQRQWVEQRFAVEARDEFEARLMHARRWSELRCRFDPPDAPQRLQALLDTRGAVLLTPHFDSFYLGIAFLAQASRRTVNAMASAVPNDPRVDAAVTAHFDAKYRGLEKALNGGRVVDMEDGVRPFYRMLERREALVVLADSPVLPGGAEMAVPFLGATRRLAGGPMRLAARCDAHIAAFVCEHEGGPHYRLRWREGGAAAQGAALARLYGFMGDAIAGQPGRWWAMDLLPNLPPVDGPGSEPA